MSGHQWRGDTSTHPRVLKGQSVAWTFRRYTPSWRLFHPPDLRPPRSATLWCPGSPGQDSGSRLIQTPDRVCSPRAVGTLPTPSALRHPGTVPTGVRSGNGLSPSANTRRTTAVRTISATGTAGTRWESKAKPPIWIWRPLLDSHPASASYWQNEVEIMMSLPPLLFFSLAMCQWSFVSKTRKTSSQSSMLLNTH